MTLPSLHDLERMRRRIVDLVQAEQYLNVLDDDLALGLYGAEVDLKDSPRRLRPTTDGETHIGAPYEPDKDLALILDVFDDAIERSGLG